MLVTDKAPMSTTALATIMRNSEQKDGLACYYALNLDGGTSSQLYADIGDVKLDRIGLSTISDALLVLPR